MGRRVEPGSVLVLLNSSMLQFGERHVVWKANVS